MPTNFTGSQIKDTYDQILHVDGGPTASEKIIYSGSQIGAGAPITWAANDSLALHIEYEIS